MQSSHNAIVQTPQTERDNQRVEVMIESHEGVECVALRYSIWTDGLGWCRQKTIRLDGAQLDEVQRALTVARHRLKRHQAEAGQLHEPAQVIQLPTLA